MSDSRNRRTLAPDTHPMLTPLAWRPCDLGTSTLAFVTPSGVLLELQWMDGGGFVASMAVWRVGGRATFLVEAGMS